MLRDNSGGVTTEELLSALQRLGAAVGADELRAMVETLGHMDEDRDSPSYGERVLDYHEFFLAVRATPHAASSSHAS